MKAPEVAVVDKISDNVENVLILGFTLGIIKHKALFTCDIINNNLPLNHGIKC